MERPFIVYMATNKVNGHRYVGATSKKLAYRRQDHLRLAKNGIHKHCFVEAIREHGADSFEWIAVAKCLGKRSAFELEEKLIADLEPEYNVATAAMKKVVRLDDGTIYESASAAAMANDVRASMIVEVCNQNTNRKTAAGCVFRYFGNHHGGPEEATREKLIAQRNLGKSKRKAVRCLNDGLFFDGVQEAAAHYGIRDHVIHGICSGISKKTKSGLIFRYEDSNGKV